MPRTAIKSKSGGTRTMSALSIAFYAKQMISEALRGIAGVNGIGITWDGDGQPCVQVNIDVNMEETSRLKIPLRVDGVPVLIEETSRIEME